MFHPFLLLKITNSFNCCLNFNLSLHKKVSSTENAYHGKRVFLADAIPVTKYCQIPRQMLDFRFTKCVMNLQSQLKMISIHVNSFNLLNGIMKLNYFNTRWIKKIKLIKNCPHRTYIFFRLTIILSKFPKKFIFKNGLLVVIDVIGGKVNSPHYFSGIWEKKAFPSGTGRWK